MAKRARVAAPAKLNLHLAVGPRRPDGFHELESLFQALSFGDELELSLRKDAEIEIQGDFAFPAQENIVHRALQAFRKAAGLDLGFTARVEKRVPMGGGLGGGSSDAAAALRAANALLGTVLDEGALAALAASLGSDVPFFLGGPAAIGRGRGELLRPLEPRGDLSCVLVEPGISVSTKDAYAWVDEFASPVPLWRADGDIEECYRRDPAAWDFRNSFFDPVSMRHPELLRALDALLDAGADFAAMSGSGSTIFGIFGSASAAEAARERLSSAAWRARGGFLLAREADIILE